MTVALILTEICAFVQTEIAKIKRILRKQRCYTPYRVSLFAQHTSLWTGFKAAATVEPSLTMRANHRAVLIVMTPSICDLWWSAVLPSQKRGKAGRAGIWDIKINPKSNLALAIHISPYLCRCEEPVKIFDLFYISLDDFICLSDLSFLNY